MAVREVAKGVYRIPLAWSNVYVLTEGREAVLIDAGLRKDLPQLLAGLQSLQIEPKQVSKILLTHAHTDHAGCAAWFAANTDAEIWTHSVEAPYLRTPRRTYVPEGLEKLRHPFSSFLFAMGEILYPVPRCATVRTFEEDEEINVPGGRLKVIATPGHAPGHVSFWREADRVLFSGDAVLTLIPILLRNELSLPMRVFSSDWAEAKRSAKKLAFFAPDILLTGHGLPLTHHTAQQLNDWTQTLHCTARRECSTPSSKQHHDF